ncbi:MAG: ABC transporter substrate-binding protein [Thermotogae bacterium]|nr:ABC transporter substrate-binding protein [Thermotogota bacterium]
MNKQIAARVFAVINIILAGVLVYILTEPARKASSVLDVKIVAYKDLSVLPVLVAKEKGLFEKYKLNPTIDFIEKVTDEVSLVTRGTYHFAAGIPFEIFVFKAKDNPELPRLIYLTEGTVDHPQSALFVIKGRINSIEDLKNKKIGYLLGTKQREILESILKDHGIPYDSVRLMGMTLKEIMNAYKDGLVDAVLATEPARSYLIKVEGKEPLIDAFLEKNFISPYPYGIGFTSLVNVQLRKNIVKRLVNVIREALSQVESNPKEAFDYYRAQFDIEADYTPDLPYFNDFVKVNQSTIDNFVNELSRREIILFEVNFGSLILNESTLK